MTMLKPMEELKISNSQLQVGLHSTSPFCFLGHYCSFQASCACSRQCLETHWERYPT